MKSIAFVTTAALALGVAGAVLAANPWGDPSGRLPPGKLGPAARHGPANEDLRGGDPIAGIYGHAVVILHGGGETEKLWIEANHTFTWQGPNGERGHGRWSLAGGGRAICLAAMTGADGSELGRPAAPRCAPIEAPGHGVGDRWTQSNDKGERVSVTVQG